MLLELGDPPLSEQVVGAVILHSITGCEAAPEGKFAEELRRRSIEATDSAWKRPVVTAADAQGKVRSHEEVIAALNERAAEVGLLAVVGPAGPTLRGAYRNREARSAAAGQINRPKIEKAHGKYEALRQPIADHLARGDPLKTLDVTLPGEARPVPLRTLQRAAQELGLVTRQPK